MRKIEEGMIADERAPSAAPVEAQQPRLVDAAPERLLMPRQKLGDEQTDFGRREIREIVGDGSLSGDGRQRRRDRCPRRGVELEVEEGE